MRPPRHLLFIFLVTLGMALTSAANDIDYRTEQSDIKSFISFGLENSKFDVNGTTITGFGGKLDFSHYIDNKVNFQVFLSSAINAENSVSSSFTGLGGYFYYSVLGACCQSKKLTSIQGVPVISETRPQENVLNVGAGIDQYMLNGTSTVYPASGIGFSVNYLFNLIGQRWKIEVRQSNLNLGEIKINGLIYGIGISIPI